MGLANLHILLMMMCPYDSKHILSFLLIIGALSFASSCDKENYLLQENDVIVYSPEDGYTIKLNQLLRVNVDYPQVDGLTYQWSVEDKIISNKANLEYMFETAGEYHIILTVSQGNISYKYTIDVNVIFDAIPENKEDVTAYITKVLDYMPAVGQFTNTLPAYEKGDTQEIMNKKVLDAIGNNNKGMITLGGWGGYVVVGFDHTIINVKGNRDFRVLGNAFYADANPNPNAPIGGSCEPGVIMVAFDANLNGVPDENEWYEIAGSSHIDATKEPWYEMSKKAGNDVTLYNNYSITYYKPDVEPSSKDEWNSYIKWKDNYGHSGYKVKNMYHTQPYYPLWAECDSISFHGTCLPQNGIDESGKGVYYVLYKYYYGYVDNEVNALDDSSIDISWTVNKKGQFVNLPGVDFIKIYTGVNQENGWLGECSTEVTGVEDLHILDVDIDTR